MSLADYADSNDGRGIIHTLEGIETQLRIANLITVAGWVMDSTKEDVGYDLDKLRIGVAGEIWEALGLSKPDETPLPEVRSSEGGH